MSDYNLVLTTEELKEYIRKYSFKREIKYLDWHNTWIPTHRSYFKALENRTEIEACRLLQNSMKNSHLNRGFSTIAQHLTLNPNGTWTIGRNFNLRPASMSGHNDGSLMVEIIGNFDTEADGEFNKLGYDELEGLQKLALYEFTIFFFEFFNIPFGNNTLRFHNEYSSKTCPGTSISKGKTLSELIIFARMNKTYIQGDLTKSENNDNIKANINNEGSDRMTFEKMILKKGTKHNAVRALQDSLNDLGYNVGVVDGDFGSKTDIAVRQFQRDNGLDDDGIVGKYTLSMLDKRLNELRNETIEQVTEQPNEQVKEYKCVKEGWRVRSEASLDAQSVRGSLSYGDTIKVLKTTSGSPYGGSDKWYKYEWNGHIAYSHSLGFEEINSKDKSTPKLVIITGEKTNLIESKDFAMIKTRFDNLGHAIVNKPISRCPYSIMMNWSLYNGNTKESVVPLIWNGKIIKQNWYKTFTGEDGKQHKHKVSAIVYLKDGRTIFGKVNDVTKDFIELPSNRLVGVHEIQHLVSGIGLGAHYSPNSEGWYGADSGVLRPTYHTGMVLCESGNVYLFVTKVTMSRKDSGKAKEIVEHLGEKVIGVLGGDSGGSSEMKYKDREFHLTSRYILDLLYCLEW